MLLSRLIKNAIKKKSHPSDELDWECLNYWVDLGWLPDSHTAALSVPLLNRTEGEDETKYLEGQDKDRGITHQLLSWANQIRL